MVRPAPTSRLRGLNGRHGCSWPRDGEKGRGIEMTTTPSAAVTVRADEVLARHEQIALSERDYSRFVEIMTADTELTPLAREEAAEFKAGRMEGVR